MALYVRLPVLASVTAILTLFLFEIIRYPGSQQVTPKPSQDTSVVDALNEMYNNEEGGVFVRIVGQGWTKPWEGCETWSDPCSAYARVGRLSFLVFNRLYWDKNTSRLMLPDDGILEVGQTTDMGFIGTELARQQTGRCMFTIDGWTEFRFNDGCGCTTQSDKYVKLGPLRNFSNHQTDGWQGDCHQPNFKDWCTALPAPRTIPLSNSTVESPERFDCAWQTSELKQMMSDYKANLKYIPNLSEHWTEVVVDATKWNKGLADGNIQAFFIRADKCMPGSNCYKDFVRWYGEYQAVYGSKPVLVLDIANETTPFSLFEGTLSKTNSNNIFLTF